MSLTRNIGIVALAGVLILAGYYTFILFITQVMPNITTLSLVLVAIIAGIATFFNPCSFPTIPAYLTSFFVIPISFMRFNGNKEFDENWLVRFINRHSKSLGIKSPKVYAIDKPELIAFSFKTFKSAIFLSIGIFEMFTKKEVKAVLLHELMHIKRSSSMLKFSNMLMKIFSPFSIISKFNHYSGAEEKIADDFVIKTQKMNRYLISAKRKLKCYNLHNAK